MNNYLKSRQINRHTNTVFTSYLFVLTCLILISQINCGGKVDNEGLYKILGVSNKATTKEIRVAFKKIALIKHPDKNPVRFDSLISNEFLMNSHQSEFKILLIYFSYLKK